MPIDIDDISFYGENNILIACAWNKMIRAKLFKENNLMFIEGITAEDVDWCARLAKAAIKFDYINIEAVAYRQREGSITRTPSLKKVSCLECNISETERIAESSSKRAKLILYPYLSYQVGVLLFNVSSLCIHEQKRYRACIKKHIIYLRYSKSKKIVLLNTFFRILGYYPTLRLLSLWRN